jgi:tetratricopeptide (TPR) repeat protein
VERRDLPMAVDRNGTEDPREPRAGRGHKPVAWHRGFLHQAASWTTSIRVRELQLRQLRPARDWPTFFWMALGLAALNFLVYWQLTGARFLNFDDDAYVANNPSVTGGLTWAGARWALTAIDYFYWHPLTWLSHMLDCQVFGLNAGGHHLTNLLIHIANTLLVFALLRRMTGHQWRSGVVAALFSIHPLAVESVAWVAERKNLLGGFFCLLTLWAYVDYAQQPSGKRYRWVMAAFIAGLMSKPILVTLPVVLLLVDYWPLRRPEWDSREGILRLATEKLPLVMLAGFSSALTYVGVKRLGALDALAGLSMPTRVANALYSYLRYLELAAWPKGLAILYPYDLRLPLWKGLISGLALAALTAALFRARKTKPYLLAGWLWFLVILVPSIGLVQAGTQALADRFTYIPLIGIFIAVVWGAGDVLKSRPRVAAAMAVAVLSLCVACASLQTRYWKDSITVFGRAVSVTRNNSLAEFHLGSALEEQGRPADAIPHLREAIRLEPRLYPAYYKLGSALRAVGQPEEAADNFRLAVHYRPD